MKIFKSWTSTVLSFFRGEITAEQLRDPNAKFLFNCGPQHCLPWLWYKNPPLSALDAYAAIGFEAAWALTSTERPTTLVRDHLIWIDELPEPFREKAWFFNQAMDIDYARGQIFINTHQVPDPVMIGLPALDLFDEDGRPYNPPQDPLDYFGLPRTYVSAKDAIIVLRADEELKAKEVVA